ncbi:MAG TPA: hypothetical protein VJ831_15650 [Jatrophihabitantaceae bacterium]|nr:hypothetical protein [Jatrophihabitantaceae bacterium]
MLPVECATTVITRVAPDVVPPIGKAWARASAGGGADDEVRGAAGRTLEDDAADDGAGELWVAEDELRVGRMLGTEACGLALADVVAVATGLHVIGGYDRTGAVGMTNVSSVESEWSEGRPIPIASAAQPATAISATHDVATRPAPIRSV